MKLDKQVPEDWQSWSRPARGAWVEIFLLILEIERIRSRPARGAWVEIAMGPCMAMTARCRAPQGARGLKLHPSSVFPPPMQVAPRKGRVG